MTVINVLAVLAIVGFVGVGAWAVYLTFNYSIDKLDTQTDEFDQLLAMIQKKDERISELDADYKALVESYLRETGKVYVRPAGVKPDRLQPPEPNPFRFKPPPPYVPPPTPKRKAQ